MNAREKTPVAAPTATAAAAVWGTVLPVPAVDDDFELRVQRAWQHLTTAYFSVEEQGRLQAAVRGLLDSEPTPNE